MKRKPLALAGVHPYNPLTGIISGRARIDSRPIVFRPVRVSVRDEFLVPARHQRLTKIGRDIYSSFPEE